MRNGKRERDWDRKDPNNTMMIQHCWGRHCQYNMTWNINCGLQKKNCIYLNMWLCREKSKGQNEKSKDKNLGHIRITETKAVAGSSMGLRRREPCPHQARPLGRHKVWGHGVSRSPLVGETMESPDQSERGCCGPGLYVLQTHKSKTLFRTMKGHWGEPLRGGPKWSPVGEAVTSLDL